MLAIVHLLGTFVVNLFKSRRRLEVENLFLRHYPLLGPDLHRLDRTSLRLAHLFDHLVGEGEHITSTGR